MECNRATERSLYFDGELDGADERAFERHLEGCAGCRAELAALESLRGGVRAAMPREQAPAALRARIEARLRRRPAPAWQALAAAGVLAFVAGSAATAWWTAREAPEQRLARELFAGHWRALAAASPVDVVSSDRHTVKPWFAGKVAQSPLVQDFAAQGFPLVGGRIDYAGDARMPVLVYRHGQHVIDVFVLGDDEAGAIGGTRRSRGYVLVPTRLGSQPAALVSDMDDAELARFEQLLEAAR